MNNTIKRPSLFLAALEGRALYELGAFTMAFPWLQAAPAGDGHPVMVLPGFMASDVSTIPLRTFLKSRGYKTVGWGQGRNYGRGIDPVDGIPDNSKVVAQLKQLNEEYGRQVSLVGWSLGGIYAREIARLYPDLVRQVITLGSPFNGHPRANNVWALFEKISGYELEEIDSELMEQLMIPPDVPSTAIYSRTDGIAAWQTCIENDAPESENIGVLSSHSGLGHNPLVLWLVAERLAQPEGEWQPFERKGWTAWLYGTPEQEVAIW